MVETHIHNDYVSGGPAMAGITGADYVVAAEHLPFEHVGVGDGDEFTTGGLRIRVTAAPGHTHHHVAYRLAAAGTGEVVGVLPEVRCCPGPSAEPTWPDRSTPTGSPGHR